MMLRVLHLDEQTGWRGGELQASWLMQGLAARGHQVYLAARPRSPMITHAHGGANIMRWPMALRGELDLASAWKLARLIRRFGIHIVHAHTSHTHSIALLCRALCPGVKVVVHRRVSFPPKRDPLNRWKYHAPDRMVCVSEAVRQVLLDYGMPEGKLALVHSAVDLARLDVPPAERAALGVPEGVPLLFNAGSLVGHKDQATLLEAFALVKREVSDARLLIAGEGPLREELERKIAALGLEEWVGLLGQRSDVPAITRAADVYVSSSWSEGLGTSVLEALGAGTPVVATKAGGVGEMVIDGETGRLVEAKDAAALARAIVETLRNREACRKLAERGRKLVTEKFGVERMVEGNVEVYSHLIPGNRQ